MLCLFFVPTDSSQALVLAHLAVVEVLTEVWSEELIKGREVIVPDIGRLRIEVQDMKAGDALVQHGRLRRVYGRFRPSANLKQLIEEGELEQT